MVVSVAVFDLDGTLIDSYRDIASALDEVLVEVGAEPLGPDVIRTMIGGGAKVLIQRALGERVDELFEETHARFYDAYRRRLLETTRPYDGVRAMLDGLRAANVTCAIATNKPAAFTVPVVEGLELHLPTASADEVDNKKPDPAVVRLALERAGCAEADPREVAYVGDMPIDAATAARFGGPFFGVGWGFDPEGLRAQVSTLSRTPDQLLDRLLGRRAPEETIDK